MALGVLFGGLWLAVSVPFGSSLLSFSFGYLESMSQGYDTPVAFPVWGAGGIVGLVPSTAVAGVRPSRRTEVFVQDLVIAWSDFSSATVAEPMPVVAKRAQDASKRHVLIYNLAGDQVGYLDLAGDFSFQPA